MTIKDDSGTMMETSNGRDMMETSNGHDNNIGVGALPPGKLLFKIRAGGWLPWQMIA